jgi:hypothetical protein
MFERPFGPSGWLDVRVWRDGVLIEHTWDANIVVSNARLAHAQLVGGAVIGNSITQIGFGSSSAAPALGNTGLSVDAYIKSVDQITYPFPNQVAFDISLAEVEANGIVLAEYGLLLGNGGLYARRVRSAPLNKDASVRIAATWTVSF